jgi:hypothetical protein
MGSSSSAYTSRQTADSDYATGHHPTFMYPPGLTETNLNIVDIDELSSSLGLPSARKAPQNDGPPARMNSQGAPDALYGKLIDKALNKPLTADALAHYMRSRSESSEETVKPPRSVHDPFLDHGTSAEDEIPALKVVQPPPGFGMQMPRMVTKDESTYTGAMGHGIAVGPMSPSAYLHQHPYSNQARGPAFPVQHHTRYPSGRRYPRRHTRTKRTDQGPEPSAADIYPDDAHWTPVKRPVGQNYFSPPPPVVHTEDAASWPTPAEVFQPKPPAPTLCYAPPPFEPYMSPVKDKPRSDVSVDSFWNYLPEPHIPNPITFGAHDLPEEREMSPEQKSGMRYGLNFHGIGLGDVWAPPKHWEGPSDRYRADPFRVRPRDHEGWGGWDWAIKNGWADAA